MSFGMTYEEMKGILQMRLKPSRFRHSLGVAETAEFLAHRFGADEQRASIAGLLHDCAREYRNEEMVHEAEQRGISIGMVERSMPLLLHASIGACLVRERYRVDDPAVEQAIRRHTVGGAGMTSLDKIIWFADMIEPGRNYPEVEKLRRMARESSLDEMVFEGLSDSLRFVLDKGNLIHPDTVQARNEILLNRHCNDNAAV